jgi:hypothetical protein
MATLFRDNASPGAPTLNGVNGSLCAVLDWALLLNGWTIEFTATNARIYRPASGNRFRLSVRHDSAISGDATLATVRGCESATSATALVNPFPTTAQLPNSTANWLTSEAPDTAARSYRIAIGTTWIILAVRPGIADSWDMQFFGDLPKTQAEDAWNTLCTSRGSSTTGADASFANDYSPGGAYLGAKMYWARSVDGSVKSTLGCLMLAGAGQMGSLGSLPAARQGYGNRIVREKISVGDAGGSTAFAPALTVHRRGWMPNLWNPLHAGAGGLTSADTHTDTSYSASSVFRAIPVYGSCWALLEESDTWSAPVG